MAKAYLAYFRFEDDDQWHYEIWSSMCFSTPVEDAEECESFEAETFQEARAGLLAKIKEQTPEFYEDVLLKYVDE